jgi:hypothetical protein
MARNGTSRLRCFVLMPFAQSFGDVYAAIRTAIEKSVPGEQVDCRRLDEVTPAGRITDRLVRELNEAAIVVADLTGNNPNVMWEAGYAMALRKPLLVITQDLSQMPFDLKDMLAIKYDRESLTDSLIEPLGKAFKDTLVEYEVPTTISTQPHREVSLHSITVTGSMEGNEARCRRRIEYILSPYLARNVSWLCGSFGLADECALDFLLAHKEEVTVVGYDSYDISAKIRSVVLEKKMPFLDAQKEQLPKELGRMTPRDALFLSKSELAIFLWSGASEGIRALIRLYKEQGRDHVVGFF